MNPEPAQARRHVLLVDDEHDFVAELRLYLGRRGWAVTVSHSPQEALAQLKRHGDITVIVTDMRLAALDGLELARQVLREYNGQRAVAVLVVTGHGELAAQPGAPAPPALPILRKPLDMACFLTTLEAAVARAQDARRAAAGVSAPADPARGQ